MKTVYLGDDFKCHTTNVDGTFREVVLSEKAEVFFTSKCQTFIEGYRLKPDGETWIGEDGTVFSGGEMISPWKDYNELDAAQREYERQMLSEYAEALKVVGVDV
jgi:hypothetical protein